MRLFIVVAALAIVLPPEAHAVPRKEWLSDLQTTLPGMLCIMPVMKECYAATREECSTLAHDQLGICGKEVEKSIPPQLSMMASIKWGAKLGECTGGRTRRKLPLKKSLSSRCRSMLGRVSH